MHDGDRLAGLLANAELEAKLFRELVHLRALVAIIRDAHLTARQATVAIALAEEWPRLISAARLYERIAEMPDDTYEERDAALVRSAIHDLRMRLKDYECPADVITEREHGYRWEWRLPS